MKNETLQSRQDSQWKNWKHTAAWFLASQNLSIFGSGVVGFSILWHITLETSSGLWMTLYTVCALLPTAIILPWGGVLADRHSRKTLIMASDGFIALATLGLAVLYLLGLRQLELLLAVSVVRSIGAGVQTPAVTAIFPQIVPKEELTRVQGINQSLNSVLFLLSPAIGGVVLGSLGIVWAFMIDVVTATLAILVMAGIRVQQAERQLENTSVIADLRRGVNYVRGHKVLRRLILCFGAMFFLLTPAAVLSPLLIERAFAGQVWHLTANELTWSIGSLAGGIYVSIRGEFNDKIRTIALCVVASGVCFACLGLVGNFWLFVSLVGVSGFFVPPLMTAQTVFVQETVEDAMLGRVFSLFHIIVSLSMPVAILFFGPLSDVVAIEHILLVSGTVLTATGIIYARHGNG